MKYFTDELWSKINSMSKEERDEADLQWNKNMNAYWQVFETIKNRLSNKFVKTFIDNHCFHDYQIINILVTQKEYGYKNPVSIDIFITDGDDKFKITYKCIKKFTFDYQERNGHYLDRRGIDDWGYSEILPIDEQILSHEILFASGSTILIYFKNSNIFVSKLNKRE